MKYGLPLPTWVTIELSDFWLLSVFYKDMAVKDKTVISQKYDISDWQIMESWLRALNYVSNVVAHHSRLWNRNLIDQPKLGKTGDMPAFNALIGNTHSTSRVYVVLCILAHYISFICPRCRLGVTMLSNSLIPFPPLNIFNPKI
jgi:abortive infection bacteriophage resistance protein